MKEEKKVEILKKLGVEIKKELLNCYGENVYNLLDPCRHCPHFDDETFTCDNPDCEVYND